MPIGDRLRSILGGSPSAEVMRVSGPEPCEDCGASPADDLVGVRWLCATCAPAARLEERAADASRMVEPSRSPSPSPEAAPPDDR